MARDFTALFRGVTTPLKALYDQIIQQGWEISSLAFQQDRYVAKLKNPTSGEVVERYGPNEKTALANGLLAVTRRNFMRMTKAQHKVGQWQKNWNNDVEAIAKAYAEAPIYDPKAVGAWHELAQDSERRYAVLAQQLQIEVTDDPESYQSVQEMCADIHQNKHFVVSRANADHPVWTLDQNVAFRIVHDIMGHCVSGGSFDWVGENLACGAHFPLLSPEAQRALFTECIGQTAYAAFYRGFGPQKVAFLDEFLEPTQAEENPAAHQGIHPSQTLAPTSVPNYSPTEYEKYGLPKGTVAPHQEALGLTPVFTSLEGWVGQKLAGGGWMDPNWSYDTGIQPAAEYHALTQYGDPLQHAEVRDTAAKMDTGWAQMDENDPSDRAVMKQAIVNALRAVLLSPRKDLRWNAVHYQDISHIPADVSDPKVYWDALEARRRAHNEARGRHPDAHLIYFKPRQRYYQLVAMMNPNLAYDKAIRKADKAIFEMRQHEEQKLLDEDSKKASDKQRSADEIDRRVNEAIAKKLKLITDEAFKGEHDVPEQDQMSLVAKLDDNYIDEKAAEIRDSLTPEERPDKNAEALYRLYAVLALTKGKDTTLEDVHDAWAAWTAESDGDHDSLIPFEELTKKIQAYDEPYMKAIHKCAAGQTDLFTGEDAGFYGAWMGSHLKAIAQVSQHADELLDAALQDVREQDGSGHHFRSSLLRLGVPGAGPKVASFAWLLLQPLTSQLATIDTHMMDVLGHNYEKEMNNRDYFKFERELQAGRDAAGYQHVPLGQFQWGMWDLKRTGEGSHQDHSAMRVLDPAPHHEIDWASKTQNLKADEWAKQAPEWWQMTQMARDQVAQHWDQNVAPQTPRNQVPFVKAGSAPENSDRVYIDKRGLALTDGTERWFTGPHVQYMHSNGVHPDDVQAYLQSYTDGTQEDITPYYPNWHREEYERTKDNWNFAKTAARDFAYWWKKGRPHKLKDVKKLAEYAKGTETPKEKAIAFVKSHRTDIEGDSNKFVEEFEARFSKTSAAFSQSVPWHMDEKSQEKITGAPGTPLMRHLRDTTGLTTQEVWDLDLEAGKDHEQPNNQPTISSELILQSTSP